MEKLAFTLVTMACKLKPYFQVHTVIILMDKPLQRAMSSLEAAGRMALWEIELSEFDIQYRPRTAIKGQVITDFIIEFTNMEGQGQENVQDGVSIWTDCPTDKQAELVWYFPTTNNEVEYKALIAGLDLAKAARATDVVVYCDSQVVTSQVNGDYECKGEQMKKYLEQVKK